MLRQEFVCPVGSGPARRPHWGAAFRRSPEASPPFGGGSPAGRRPLTCPASAAIRLEEGKTGWRQDAWTRCVQRGKAPSNFLHHSGRCPMLPGCRGEGLRNPHPAPGVDFGRVRIFATCASGGASSCRPPVSMGKRCLFWVLCGGAWDGPPPRFVHASTLTAILRGFELSARGRRTVRTPCFRSAEIFAWSTSSPSWNWR